MGTTLVIRFCRWSSVAPRRPTLADSAEKRAHRSARSGGRSRPLGDDCGAGNPAVDEQTDELVEQYFEIAVASKFVMLVDDPVVGEADRLQLRLAGDPDHDLSEPRRRLEFDAHD